MAEKFDIVDVIEEMKTTQKQVLQSLREIVNRQTCTCPCHTRDSAEDIELLESRVKELEENEEKKKTEICDLRKQLQAVREEINSMERIHFRGDDLGSRIDLCPDNASLNESPKTEKTVSTPMVQTEKNKDDGRKGVHKKIKNVNAEKRRQKTDEENKPSIKDLTRQKPEIIDNSPIEMNLPKLDTPQNSATKTVTKPNFKKESLSERLGVRVIEQTKKRTIDFMDWHRAASQEETQGQLSGLATLKGVFTVVCVDISYSMTQGDAWQQAKTFFQDFTDSLKESSRMHGINKESVALVTFGHKTEVLKRLTKDFSSLQMAFDGISLGGPSPMYGGLLHSVAAAQTAPCSGGASVNGIPTVTKIVLITDGYPTDTGLVEGPDELTPSKADETNAQIYDIMENMEGTFDLFCVPVGNADMAFLKLMTSISDGKMITYKDGWKVGQRLRNTLRAGTSVVESESDREDIQDILERAQRRIENLKSVKSKHCYNEVETDRLPEIGSRVRRGPDWKYNNQDGNGPGTVIGHTSNEKQIWIEWDENEHIDIYNYHAADGFDVLIDDVPRRPKPDGRLTVGCLVKPGIDWKNNTRNVKVTDTGVVIKIESRDKVRVHWNNRERGEYSYGMDGIFEIEFSPPERSVGESEARNPIAQSTGAQGHPTSSQEDQYYVPQSQISQPRKDNSKSKFRNKNMT